MDSATRVIQEPDAHSSKSPFWSKHLDGVSCIFPRLSEDSSCDQAITNLPSIQYQRVQCFPSATADTTLSIQVDGTRHTDLYCAAWAILLGRYLGTDRVCFGTVEELTTSPSPCYYACPVLLTRDENVSSAILECRKSLETSRPYGFDTPSAFHEAIGLPRQPCFNTAIWLVNHRLANSNSDLNGIDGPDLSPFPLILVVSESAAPNVPESCYLQYSPSLLSDSAASLVVSNYRTILAELVSNLDVPLRNLRTLSLDDLAKTWGWNKSCPSAVNHLVHDIFKQNVVLRPQAPAIHARDASFTYQELDHVSNVLSQFLVHKGVGPEVVVPLCFEKSPWATVSMLAVAKAGGVFTFLDPSHPPGVLRDIVRHTNADIILSSASGLAICEGILPVFEVSLRSLQVLPRLFDPPQGSVEPSNLLYIVFTSGTTGKPKGICVEHSSYLSSALQFANVTGIGPSSRVLQFASYSFDASILENFTTLISGGCVCIPDDESRGKGIAHILNEFHVNWAFLTPSLAKLVSPNAVPNLKTLLLAGETPSKANVDTWAGTGVRLMNGYGPAECCIASAVHPSLDTCTEAANIGWSVGGLLWVVDMNDAHQLVPVGAVGELAIEGPHLGRGYLNDPERTASAFPDSLRWTADFSPSRSRRVYLTGDLVRQNMDGSVIFVGRKDTQVKLRGMRIELGAVEQHLSADGSILLANVVAPTLGACKSRLVAVLSFEGGNSAESDDGASGIHVLTYHGRGTKSMRQSVRDIRDNLAYKVPGYMVPSCWFVLGSFPLMPSGKIDRAKVKKWIEGMDSKEVAESECLLDQDSLGVSPDNTPLILLQAIRRAVGHVLDLPIDCVIPTRSFIGLGGDSISAMQLLSQLQINNIIAKVRDILRCASITELAILVEPSHQNVNAVQVKEVYDIPFDLSPIQRLYFQWEPEGTRYKGGNRFNQSFLLRVKQRVSSSLLAAALKGLVKRHSSLRSRFVKSSNLSGGEIWQQVISTDVENSHQFAMHRISEVDEIDGIIHRSHCAIDMFNGPLFIVDLINGSQDQLLSMIAHHAVVDLVSWRVIIRDLELVLQGETLPPQLSLPWQVWCGLQENYAQQNLPPRVAYPHYSKIASVPVEYWGMESRHNLMKDVATTKIQLDAVATTFLMNPDYYQTLRAQPVDLFLAAIFHSFNHVFPDHGTPTIFRESHGREPWDDWIDISSTVGWFTTMYPIQIDSGRHDLRDTVRRVRDAQRRVPRNGWPYFASRYHNLKGMEDFSLPPMVEIIFDFLGRYQQLEREDGLFEQQSWENSDVGPEFHRPGLFEVTAEIIRGSLQLRFDYNSNMHHQVRITEWVQECEKALYTIVSELGKIRDEATLGQLHALSDYPLLSIGYEGLDHLFTSVLPRLQISVGDIEDIYDTSPMQTGLLLSQAKEPGLYQCSMVFRVETRSPFESVDMHRLCEAWRTLVSRHSSLRTIFVTDVSNRDAFTQIILKRPDVRIARITCSAAELDANLNATGSVPLQNALPPHKFTIIEVEGGRVLVRIDINHASIDGASGGIIAKEFVSLYDGSLHHSNAPVYRDFILRVQERDLEEGLNYWTRCLDEVEPCHIPVLDDGVSQDGSFKLVRVDSSVSVGILSQYCQAHNITLPTFFKLVWSLILRAYCGSDRVCFGYLVSGRDVLNTEDQQNAIGAFVNILTCRSDLSQTLQESLKGVQEDSLTDLEHQYCSLAHVQQRLGSKKLIDQQPLFNTILNFQVQTPDDDSSNAESSISLVADHTTESTEFSCVVDICICGERLDISLAHRTTLISPGQADNIANAFTAGMQAILQAPITKPAKQLDLFGEIHKNRVWAWNRTVPPRVDTCIHDIVSRHALSHPEASAVESWDAAFTYQQLDEITTVLGHHLVHLGVQVGSIVPICFERSAWTIVSLMAVLKAGGTFVLLDPKHISIDRTAGIIQDTAATILLAGKNESILLSDIISTQPISIVTVSLDAIAAVKGCTDCSQRRILEGSSLGRMTVSPQTSAYIVFTSATTGNPKGSVTAHSAFCTAAAAYGKRAGLSRNTRILQYASYTFDACLAEILSILLFGGCVCVPTEQQRTDDITGALNQTRANFAILTPSVARLINPTEVPHLKTLGLVGEAMSKSDILRWKDHTRMINAYGPSECSIACTLNDAVREDPANIGTSAGSLCWVVDPDDHNRLMPIGSVGELIVEGFSVSNGYFNNETKTAEVFISPPAWLMERRSDIGHRVYKTGDLVRYNSDGSMNIIGRKDTQSKFHGQRIELGEIEQHLLSRSASFKAVAVEIIEPEARQRRQTLATFFVSSSVPEHQVIDDPTLHDASNLQDLFLDLQDDLTFQLQTLQTSLADVLPSYMIPSVFIPLKKFPLASSGKLNRKVLREEGAQISAARLNQYSLLVATHESNLSNEIAKRLHLAWVEALGISPETINGDTSFFRVGGDSLSAMRLVSVARHNYGLGITVADIFKHPRLCDMAAIAQHNHISTDRGPDETATIKPFALLSQHNQLLEALVSKAAAQCETQKERILDLYPCTPLQEGLMTLSISRKGAYIGQSVFLLPKALDVDRLKRAWDVVVSANPILRTRIVNLEKDDCFQAVLDESITWLHPACSKEQYLADDLNTSLTWGALLNRFAIITTSNADANYLIWTAHHALFDEWSQALIFQQLEHVYHGQEMSRPAPFNRFIAHIADIDDNACAEFWAAQMDGDTPATLPRLPSGAYSPKAESCHELVFDIARGVKSHITTSTVIRAAWALVIGRHAAAEDVVFGASVSGRSAPVNDIDRINGPTMATVPVKIRVNHDQSISDFLDTVQTQATDMIAYEQWGLQNIAQVSKNKNAAFQNLLIVHAAQAAMASSPLGLEMTSEAHPSYHIYGLIAETFLADDGKQVTIRITYDVNLAPYAPRLGTVFELLIHQLIHHVNNDAPLHTLDYCSQEDKAMIFRWNKEDPKIVEDCIHEIISSNATREPAAAAICSRGVNMTYSELDHLSTKLARHLSLLGVKSETIVPAIFEKSVWTIVAQLAILKAGGVICMLDPAHPLKRLEDNIETANANLILASERYSTLLQSTSRAIVVISDSMVQSIDEAYCSPNLPTIHPENAAYVVFTSGTTGRPKASITEHRAFLSSSASFAGAMQISNVTRTLQHAAFSFDLYILETFTTLTQGGCVCLARDEVRTSPVELAGEMSTMGVTWTIMTPSFSRLLPKDRVPTLKTLNLCGEAMYQTDTLWSKSVRLMNAYGPSECSTVSALNDNVTPDSDNVAIGRGVGSRCWIVEPHDHNKLAPVGYVGELLLESPGLARGYLNEPMKTAEVFIRCPKWLQDVRPYSRLYKTGDLVRYNPADGMIVFVGRKDTQIKIHGQRMELGEIEHHLLAHDHVDIANVTLPKAGRFKGKLVATLSLRSIDTDRYGNRDTIDLKLMDSSDKSMATGYLSDIRAQLERYAPSYMIPSVWAVVYRVPLTSTLKVDKRKVMAWLETLSDETAGEIMSLTDDHESARVSATPMEHILRGIIARVLGLSSDQVILNRSFISLGGDSMSAIQLMARCRDEGITIQTKDILQSKTIMQLAESATVASGIIEDKTQMETNLGDSLFSLSPTELERVASETANELGLTSIRDIADIYPCGPTQKGILLSQARSTGTYNESFIYAISSGRSQPVDLEKLKAAWRMVVSRHTALRTVIIEDTFGTEEAYYQVVLRSLEPCLNIRFINNTDDDTVIEQILDTATTAGNATYMNGNMNTQPPHSLLLCQTPTKTFMCFEISHSLIDGESLPILLRDLSVAYEGGMADETDPPTYRDYVAYIRRISKQESFDYWMEYLEGVQPCLMPFLHDGGETYKQSTADSHETGVQSISIEFGILPEAISSFCSTHSLTPANVFQVAWAIVLRIYTGMEQVCFGYLSSGRDAPVKHIDEIVGVVCNMLVFKMQLDGTKTGLNLLCEAQDGWVNSIQHQFVALADIQHHRYAGGSEVDGTLFNTGISYRQQGRHDKAVADQAGLDFDFVGGRDSSEYDATVNILSTADKSGFCGSYSFKTSRMTILQAQSVIRTFQSAVERILEMSDRPLQEWCFVTEEEACHFPNTAPLDNFLDRSDIFDNYMHGSFIDMVVATQAQNFPKRPAICSWDGELTYLGLDVLSARLANHLIGHHGVGPEVLVPIYMEKSLWFVVSVLGILKAGGAFVPMDATLEPTRIRTTLEQTGAQLILTSSTMNRRLSRLGVGLSTLVVDHRMLQRLSPFGDLHAVCRDKRNPENAAYVMFTSGSTGSPKGVVVHHKAWCSSAMGQISAWGITPHTRALQFSSYGFDLSLADVLTTLMGGGCVCIPSDTERLNDIDAAISRMHVNMLNIVPSLLRTMSPDRIPTVKTLTLGGEPTPESEIRRWSSQVKLILGYGPTECSFMSSAVGSLSANSSQPSNFGRNIGTPTACRYWIVSASNHDVLMPAGGVGELLIEGAILAREYLNDPSRTAAAFITNPAWAARRKDEVRRMYKTGDLVQLHSDGSYVFIGRKDRQVKIRGQRVELGDIEHQIDVALGGRYSVVAEFIKNSSLKPVAFIATKDRASDNTSSKGEEDPKYDPMVSDHVKKRQIFASITSAVSSYAVPSAVIPLRDLPLMPSGKIDRSRLRQIAVDFFSKQSNIGGDFAHALDEPSLTDIQWQMRNIWAGVLGKDAGSITSDASFLEQGGDSILAIKLVSACRIAGLVVSMAEVLRHKSLAELCRPFEDPERKEVTKISKMSVRPPLSSLGPLNSPEFLAVMCTRAETTLANIEDIVETTTSQPRFIATGLLRGRGNTNYFAFHLAGNINEIKLKAACESLIRKRAILRTAFVPFKCRLFQVVLRSMVAQFRTYQCHRMTQEEQKILAVKLVEEDQAEPVKIGQPIVRFLFLKGGIQSILVMRMSHAQYDGMSIQVLIKDLEAFYHGRQTVEDCPTFLDFASASREQNEQGAEEYWRAFLAESSMTNVVSHPSPPYLAMERRMISREIPTPPSPRQASNLTLATMLKAAWALVLAEVSGSTDVVFGHVISGRNISIAGVDINEILGPCLNFIPVRVKLQEATGARTAVGDILQQVQDQQLVAIPFETFGMDKIVERCTNWPLWTRFSTIVQLQNLHGVEEALEDFDFDGAHCRLTVFEGNDDPADILVLVRPKDGGARLDVTLYYGAVGGQDPGSELTDPLSPEFVSHMLDRLIANMEMISSASGFSQPPLPDLSQIQPQIPIILQARENIHDNNGAQIPPTFEEMPTEVGNLVTKAWEHVFPPTFEDKLSQTILGRDRKEPITTKTPFYDVWGNWGIAAAQFAEFYSTAAGVGVSAEDMMKYPSKIAQGLMLTERMGISLAR
ncbi:hypothetical protein B0T17DRAFT_234637 [Bombardia bombarda]|uniref:Carrier domain-containing protein n=1 Tax=Bombardia bombarda TaxID=252184 RepID=A0AA39XBJ5_9PEZI|nr:hypothetical protein B0T17DRAFT_234637 [Bombardia bombarda]